VVGGWSHVEIGGLISHVLLRVSSTTWRTSCRSLVAESTRPSVLTDRGPSSRSDSDQVIEVVHAFVHVFGPTMPSAARPFSIWNCMATLRLSSPK